MESFKQKIGVLLGSAIYIFFIFATIFGIVRGFHKGVGQGVASVFMPPYAWYLTVAVIWEPPQWKEDWNKNTRALATVLVYATDMSAENKLFIGSKSDELKEWVRHIPKEKRADLKKDSKTLCQEYNNYVKWTTLLVMAGQSNQPYTKTISFPQNPSFEKVLQETIGQQQSDFDAVVKLIKDTPDGMENMKLGMQSYYGRVEATQNQRIEAVFSE